MIFLRRKVLTARAVINSPGLLTETRYSPGLLRNNTLLKCSDAAVVVVRAGTNVESSPPATVESSYQDFRKIFVLL